MNIQTVSQRCFVRGRVINMAVGSYHLALAEDEKRDKTEIC